MQKARPLNRFHAKLPEFTRDVLRDFCHAHQALSRAFADFDAGGKVAFEAMRDLVGEEMNKGLLWRLKDTGHHVFGAAAQNGGAPELVESFLEWGLGVIFHEVMKLKENAYQHQTYGPWFHELRRHDLPPAEAAFSKDLASVLDDTGRGVAREVARIRFLMDRTKAMMPLYFGRHRDNPLLARFLFENQDMVREVFAEEYDRLITGIYGDKPERLYLLAARSLRLGGWLDEARRAAQACLKANPQNPECLEEARENGLAHAATAP